MTFRSLFISEEIVLYVSFSPQLTFSLIAVLKPHFIEGMTQSFAYFFS